MSLFESIILGIVQGATEFLPVSSSGHLIITRILFNGSAVGSIAYDAVLQLATVLAVLVYFWKDITKLVKTFFSWIFRKPVTKEDSVMLKAILFGTVPALILGLLLEETMDTVFRASEMVAFALLFGSVLMFLAEKYAKQIHALTPKKGFFIGLFQSLALIPGVSRSGATISGGLFLGLKRETAARFSFLLSFPIIAGSGLKKLLDLIQSGGLSGGEWSPIIVSSLVAFIVGLFAIHFLITFLKKHSLSVFIWYRVILAIGILIFLR